MVTKRVCLMILLIAAGCGQSSLGQDNIVSLLADVISDVGLSKQLKINRDALLRGSGEQIRIDAATVMLFSDDPFARKILLAVLEQSENTAARSAVCKALSQTRGTQEQIKDKKDFIEPLFAILATETGAPAELAAEATLIFEYKQISKKLEAIVSDKKLSAEIRLNAVHTLKLHPDMKAIFELMDLLDDSDVQVVAGAQKALHSLGIPVGKNLKTRRQIKDELKRKGRDGFLRDWLIRQEKQAHHLESELDSWQQMYMAALDKIYDGLEDDESRGEFLTGHLEGAKVVVKLWALEKVYQSRIGTKSQLPATLGLSLLKLIADENRDVRLRTAKLLSLMSELNSSQQLLAQLEVEEDDEVKTEVFVALGGACYYAFLPNSGIDIPVETRKQTLKWAQDFLNQQQPEKAQKGAEVIKKLLEQDGSMSTEEVAGYLYSLADRYRHNDSNGVVLRAELLTSMAGLCAQSVHKAQAVKLFLPLFEQALDDPANQIREAAVEGLISSDKTTALEKLRNHYPNDSSAIVREKLITLAGEVGGKDDLNWLAEKLDSSPESQMAWQAMLKIFGESDANLLNEWLLRFYPLGQDAKLVNDEQKEFLEIAQRKAEAEKKFKMLINIRIKLADAYAESGEFERAAEYFGLLLASDISAEEKEVILARLLDAHLRSQNTEAVVGLVSNYLLERDLAVDSDLAATIDDYFANPCAKCDPKTLFNAMVKIKPTAPRPQWSQKLNNWKKLFTKPEPKEKQKVPKPDN